MHTSEVLIIGCGVGGGTAAIELADAGIPVTVITRAFEPQSTNTDWAQGGIIYKGKSDTPELLAQDVLAAGAGHSYPPAVDVLANEGPGSVESVLFERLGVEFDRGKDGALDSAQEAAHSQPRIIHVADATGRAIQIGILNALKAHPNITLLTGHTAIDLLTPGHHSNDRLAIYEQRHCVGAYVLNRKTGEVITCLAKKTILATGGLGKIFLRTTNPVGARGDGLAMAYRAGAYAINNEYIQFHPTTFHKRNAPNFLISEAVRGDGARLVNADGDPFMQKYDPEWKDLAARDVVARSIHEEMLVQGVDNVYLDLHSYIEKDRILHHFPNIGAACAEYGIDITKDLVPVVPGAHYSCGGVWTDLEGRTTLRNLYAVGEVSCTGIHGANRLASTSLLEGLVWGKRVATDVGATLADSAQISADLIPDWRSGNLDAPDPALITQDMRTIQHIMTNYVGLVRTQNRLQRAMRELRHLETEIEQFYRQSEINDDLIGLRNAVRAAIITTSAAWANKVSMGCHYRTD